LDHQPVWNAYATPHAIRHHEHSRPGNFLWIVALDNGFNSRPSISFETLRGFRDHPRQLENVPLLPHRQRQQFATFWLDITSRKTRLSFSFFRRGATMSPLLVSIGCIGLVFIGVAAWSAWFGMGD